MKIQLQPAQVLPTYDRGWIVEYSDSRAGPIIDKIKNIRADIVWDENGNPKISIQYYGRQGTGWFLQDQIRRIISKEL